MQHLPQAHKIVSQPWPLPTLPSHLAAPPPSNLSLKVTFFEKRSLGPQIRVRIHS